MDVCNLDARGAGWRRVAGWALLAAGLALGALLIATGASWALRLAALPVFVVAVLTLLQARAKT